MRNEWGLRSIIAPPTSNARGVAIFFNSNFELYKVKKNEDGHFINVDIGTEGIEPYKQP